MVSPRNNIPDGAESGPEADRLCREALGGLKHGVIIYNKQFVVLEINSRARELLEISTSDFTPGESFEKIVRINAQRGGYGDTGSVEERVALRMARVVTFEPFHEDQFLFNGRHCEVYGQPLASGGFVITYTDITDRVHAQMAKNQFLAKISHDIRTPINGLLGMAELMEKSNLNEAQHKMISTIVRSSRVLAHLVDDILDLTRLESGKLTLDDEFFNIRTVLDDVVSTLQVIATTKNIHLELDLENDFPSTIFGDPMRIAQCAINLIGNAIKFSGDESKAATRVSIQVARKDAERFFISIQDSGIGIDEDKLESLFDPFVQGDYPTGKHPEGSGLGLAIVKDLANLMGGEVTVESSLGVGSTFTLHLPLVDIEDEPEVPSDSQGESSLMDTVPKRGTILVVEDNEDNREVMELQLAAIGHDAEVAVNGEDGLQKWRTGNYALILSDCNMPVMNGIEMTRRIREEEARESRPHTPIVAITGNAISSELQLCLDSGMDDYLTKPLTLDSLREKIDSVLD